VNRFEKPKPKKMKLIKNLATPKMKPLMIAALASALFAGNASAASLITIYNHSFGGSSGSGLNDIVPDTASGSFGSTDAKWAADDNFYKADGQLLTGGNGGRSAYLPFVPEAGYVFTLEVSMSVVATGTNWLSLGFSKDQDTQIHPAWNPGHLGWAWMLARGNNDGAAFVGPGPTNGATLEGSASLGIDTADTHTYRIVMDMTNGTNIADLSYFVNDTLWASATERDLSGLQYIQLGKVENASGILDSLSLTAIPEPSALALLGLAGLLMALRRRRY